MLPISNYTYDFLITDTLVRMFSKASRIINNKKIIIIILVLANIPILTLQHCSTTGLKWISGGSGVAEGPFLLLSADGAGCLGWLVSYLPWTTNIHRGPTPFGTLKSFFPCTGWEISLGGSRGLQTWLPYGPSLFSVEFRPLGCPASKSTPESLTICAVTKGILAVFMLLLAHR